MRLLTTFNLAVLVFLLPLSAHAQTGPVISSFTFQYPKLNDGPIPNTYSFPYQTAFKSGDETYAVVVADSLEPIVSAYLDASILGAGIVPLAEMGDPAGTTHQFQSQKIQIDSAHNGTVSVPVTLVTAAGTTTQAIRLVLDQHKPQVALTQLAASAISMTIFGSLEGTGTAARLFSIFVRLFNSAGTTLSNGSEYYGQQEGSTLRDLRNGAFSELRIPFLENAIGAAAVELSLLAKDEAGNIGTTSMRVSIGSAASTTTPTASSTVPLPGSRSNVLFLPAAEASRLYHLDTKVWEPGDDGLELLALSPAGKSMYPLTTQPSDIITRATWGPFSRNIYSTFFSSLSALKDQQVIGDWKAVAYDWRLSLNDLLADGSLEQELRTLASSSPTGKVTIIAHSNGGLLAKALVQKLGSSATQVVDTLVLVSVPQSGTAEAVALMLHGYGGALPFDSCAALPLIGNLCAGILSRSDSRAFAENAPVAYHLLPSAAYFRTVSDGRHHVVEFHATHAFEREREAYKSAVNSIAELYSFLGAHEGGRTKPGREDLMRANVLNSELLTYASTTHAVLDAWTPPSTLRVTQIAGFGKSTLSGIDYDDYSLPGGGVRSFYRPILSQEGDGTVQAQSAVLLKPAANVRSLWVPLGRYAHDTMLESPEVQNLITDIVRTGSTTPEHVRTTRPTAFPRRFVITLHSPLSLEAVDAHGRVTNASRAEIPDSAYGELGEAKFLSLPEASHQLLLRGTGTGTFTLDIQEMGADDAVARTTALAEVPVTPTTRAMLTVGPGTISPLTIDEDGDGTTDVTLTPRTGYTVIYKPAPVSKPVLIKKEETAATTTDMAASTTPVSLDSGEAQKENDSIQTSDIIEKLPVRIGDASTTTDQEVRYPETAAAAITALPHSLLTRILSFLYSVFTTFAHLLFKS